MIDGVSQDVEDLLAKGLRLTSPMETRRGDSIAWAELVGSKGPNLFIAVETIRPDGTRHGRLVLARVHEGHEGRPARVAAFTLWDIHLETAAALVSQAHRMLQDRQDEHQKWRMLGGDFDG